MQRELCKPIVYTKGNGELVVAVVGSVHGDESVGNLVVEALRDIDIVCGTLITVIANPCALEKSARFIDADLNRSFPGSASGNLEEQLAYRLVNILKTAQYILDVHSTVTDTCDVVIVTNRTNEVRELIRMLTPLRVVLVPGDIGEGTLIGAVNGAVSLEYGRNDDPRTHTRSLESVRRVLAELGMITEKVKLEKVSTKYFEVYSTEKLPKGFTMKKDIHNLALVERGDVLGDVNGVPVCSKDSFYPFLFGPDSYPDIMGFKARKIKEL